METFLVRIWVSSDGKNEGRDDGLHGFLEHPRSEQSWKFAGAEELLDQLSKALKDGRGEAHLLPAPASSDAGVGLLVSEISHLTETKAAKGADEQPFP